MSELHAALATYDGRSPTVLSEAARRYQDHDGYLDALVSLSAHSDASISEGATWMLKAGLEDGARLTRAQVVALVEGLEALATWQAQLHLCQSVRMLDVPEACRPRLSRWLTNRLEARRPFLRAWALDAFCRVAGPTEEAQALLDRMAADDAAAVRARVRAVRRSFG